MMNEACIETTTPVLQGQRPVACSVAQLTGIGAAVGVSIWASVAYLKPALADIDGISDKGADWITAGINLLGGLEITAYAGYLAGSIAACAVLCACAAASSEKRSYAPIRNV